MDGEDQPAASQMSEMDNPLDHAQEEAMPQVEWALTPMGHCSPKKEYANVIASTNHLEMIWFVTGPSLAQLPKPTKICSDFLYGEERAMYTLREKRGKRYDLGSERSGEHLRYITQPWFQDDLGVVRSKFQASRVDGKGLQVSN